jgi:hypothetical protein
MIQRIQNIQVTAKPTPLFPFHFPLCSLLHLATLDSLWLPKGLLSPASSGHGNRRKGIQQVGCAGKPKGYPCFVLAHQPRLTNVPLRTSPLKVCARLGQ